MSLRPIIGHRTQLAQLSQDLERENLAHAYLFDGPPHAGKTTAAHWFAREILTQGMDGERRAEALRQMDQLIHPDLLVLDALWIEKIREDWNAIARSSNVPQRHRQKAEMKTDAIAIDDVRALTERLETTGLLPRRVCIIADAERMQAPAVSAFLKTLEEPLPGRVFLLTTSRPARLLPTVLSRVRRVRFGRVGARDLQELLPGGGEEDRSFLLHTAQGAPGRLVQLLEDPDLLRAERLAHAGAAGFWGAATLHARLQALAPLQTRGPEADRFLFHLGLSLRALPGLPRPCERAFARLVAGLQTNASRPLLLQRFAIDVDAPMTNDQAPMTKHQ